MNKLVKKLEELKNSNVQKTVNSRISEFRDIGKSDEKIFSELCFCILTANFNAERSIKIQEKIGAGFSRFSQTRLSSELRRLGHRYPNTRAKYIVEARKFKKDLPKILKTLKGNELRDWLVKNIKGLGYKEASHFLRNIGQDDFAIIDFHIIDILVRYGIIEKPKTLTRKKYLEIEQKLKQIAEETNLTLAELDLYLWFLETGRVLK
ncbi:MAG: N-glycosylase/DNA lyase [Candidatus Aenigmarchaeota archaeon]|nr:N-glycosylase/DNA lyase [Candidatus Aenigmarchaeota archaeon]